MDTAVYRAQAKFILDKVRDRFSACKLEMHPVKTKIVYCKDDERKEDYPITEFEFLGYSFKQRYIRYKDGRRGMNFIATVSKSAEKSLKEKIKGMNIQRMSGSTIQMVSEAINPILRGWINYLGAYSRSALRKTLNVVQMRLVIWAMRKYKRFRGHRRRAEVWLKEIMKREPAMFAHWALLT